MEKRYVQMSSVLREARDDYEGAIRRMKEIGYTGLEFAFAFGGMELNDMKALLAELGLDPISAHIRLDQIPEHLEYAAELGLRYIVDPMARFSTYDEAVEYAKKLNETAELCKKYGLMLGYHNHSHEFLQSKDGTLYDTLLLNTDPDLVCFQMDVGWVTSAGVDAIALIKKYSGRFKMIHVKECSEVAGPEQIPDFASIPRDAEGRPVFPPEMLKRMEDERKRNVPAGKGIIDWSAVKAAAEAQGAEAFIIERANNYLDDIFECLREDCDFLKGL